MTKYKPPFLKIHEYETDSYVIIGVVDDEQMETLQESFPLKSKIPLNLQEFIVIGLVNNTTLNDLVNKYEHSSRRWRGRYQALAKAFIKAYKEMLYV